MERTGQVLVLAEPQMRAMRKERGVKYGELSVEIEIEQGSSPEGADVCYSRIHIHPKEEH